MDLLIAIAALCHITGAEGTWYNTARKDDLKCQQDYIICFHKKVPDNTIIHSYSKYLEACVLEKKL